MLYPLKFKPLYKDYVWGGRNLALLGKALPEEGIVAESWEVACHKNGSSVVANGAYEGTSLPDMIAKFGRKLIGASVYQTDFSRFPLLVKLIDAENNLSVQVHPDDAFAFVNENGECGKNEMWYIISTKPGAKIVYDVVPGTTRESFAEAVLENDVARCLNSVEVYPGDVINIPAGTVHSIGKGIILAEVQQNSDATYRVYDYGRVGRELHIDKALKVINFNMAGRKSKYTGIELAISNGCSRRIAVANDYFCTEVYNVKGAISDITNGSRFYIYVFISGNGTIIWDGDEMTVNAGESVLIPAALGKYKLVGELTALKIYKPNLSEDVIQPLIMAGIPEKIIYSEVAGLEYRHKMSK
jgi:mannose-6-phosphate isomerase